MLTGKLPDGREEIHMKKLTALLLALVMMLAAAAAEQVTQATLLFAYGDEAFDMHMREKANTIDYDGHTWLLEHDSFNYEAEFMMFGGNTRAVFEMDVPQFRIDEAPKGEVLKIGTVRITPPSKMDLLVFSGDHTTGQFTLVDSAKTDYYELTINAERDERGWLRRTDMVFLYSYNRGGRTVYYAATLYIGYENFETAPASLLPVHGVTEKPADLGGGYHSGGVHGAGVAALASYILRVAIRGSGGFRFRGFRFRWLRLCGFGLGNSNICCCSNGRIFEIRRIFRGTLTAGEQTQEGSNRRDQAGGPAQITRRESFS